MIQTERGQNMICQINPAHLCSLQWIITQVLTQQHVVIVNRRKCRVHYCAGLHYQSGRENKHKASFDEVDSLIMSPFTQNHTGHYKQKRDRQTTESSFVEFCRMRKALERYWWRSTDTRCTCTHTHTRENTQPDIRTGSWVHHSSVEQTQYSLICNRQEQTLLDTDFSANTLNKHNFWPAGYPLHNAAHDTPLSTLAV